MVILVFDVETTGINRNVDQILELAAQKGLEVDSWRKVWRFKPSIAIPKKATAIHGIREEDVANCPPFYLAIDTFRKMFEVSDVIVGYNVAFDIDMIQAEFLRAKVQPLDLKGKEIIDAYRLWSRCEPRRLEDAVRRFVKREHVAAHSALADIQATGEVLTTMLKEFGLSEQSWKDIAEFIDPERKNKIADLEQLIWSDNDVLLNFGKYKGKSLYETIKNDLAYFDWIKNKDFPDEFKKIVAQVVIMEKLEFLTWTQKSYRNNS